MGKSPKLPDSEIKKARAANRKLIKRNKDLNAQVQTLIKAAGKPKNKDEKRQINRSAYSAVIRRNPLLGKAIKENIAKRRGR